MTLLCVVQVVEFGVGKAFIVGDSCVLGRRRGAGGLYSRENVSYGNFIAIKCVCPEHSVPSRGRREIFGIMCKSEVTVHQSKSRQ